MEIEKTVGCYDARAKGRGCIELTAEKAFGFVSNYKTRVDRNVFEFVLKQKKNII